MAVPSSTHSETEASRRERFFGVAILVLAVLFVYAPVLDHEFVRFDDDVYIVENTLVNGGLTAEAVRSALTDFHLANWHPLTWWSHMLDVELFGLDPGPHHAVNVILHALAAVVLFAALYSMTGETRASLLVAALFALHPLRVESVAWASERKDVLSGLFWMLVLLAYARYARRPGAGRYAWVLVCFATGLTAKPMLVSLPVVLLVLDFWPLGRLDPSRRDSWQPLVKEKIPMLVLCAGSAWVTVLAQRSGDAIQAFERIPPIERLANAAMAPFVYLWKTVWPSGLAFYYPHPAMVDPSGASGRLALGGFSAATIVIVTWLVVRYGRRLPHVAAGWSWYLVTLVPVIGLVQVGTQAVADRYTYVPVIGISIALAWSLMFAVRSRPATRKAAAGAVVLVLVAFAATSRAQVTRWRNSETLFRHAIAVTANNFVAHTNLGRALYLGGDPEGAEVELRTSLSILDHAVSRNMLGTVLAEGGDPATALPHFRAAVRLDPDYVRARYNLALAYDELGRREEAIEAYRETLRLRPGHAAARAGLARLERDR